MTADKGAGRAATALHRPLALWVLLPMLVLLSSCAPGSFEPDRLINLRGSLPAASLSLAKGPTRDNTPVVLAAQQPYSAYKEDHRAAIDYSNAASGYICARSYMPETKVKVLVAAPDGSKYKYTLPQSGEFITIPLTEGSGVYAVAAYENLYDDQYAAILSVEIDVQLADEFGPFLYPSPYVSFSEGDMPTVLSQEVTIGARSDVEAVDQIYMYVVRNISYDYAKAAAIEPGYLPDNSGTLDTQSGICFDFASLTAAMLRAQGIPTKLVLGYCGPAYHAWIEVYTSDQGWIRREIEFRGGEYVRLDPTFDSSIKGSGDISRVIGDGTNYQPMYYY